MVAWKQKQTTFGIRKGPQRIVFMVLDPDRVRVVYLNDSSKDFLEGFSVPLDCDEWCLKKGLESFFLPTSMETEIPVQVARAIWRWLQGEGWKRYPFPVFPTPYKHYYANDFELKENTQ